MIKKDVLLPISQLSNLITNPEENAVDEYVRKLYRNAAYKYKKRQEEADNLKFEFARKKYLMIENYYSE